MNCGEMVYLMDKSSKVVTVQKCPDNKSIQLCGREEARDIHQVSVHRWSAAGEGVKLAFFFSHKTTSSSYLLKVDGGKLKLVPQTDDTITTKQNNPDEKYLFQWEDQGNGSCRCLRSVSDSSKYLFIKGNTVELIENDKSCLFQLRHKDEKNVEDGDIKKCSCWKRQKV